MSNTLTPESAALESLMAEIADEYRQRLNRGEEPDIEEYIQRYTQLAGVLRQLLPALAIVRLPNSESAGAILPLACPEPAAGCLGDYRLLREVGRGGMGIVYEAEQVSLGRRVALKVLPFAAALDPKQLQRFRIEAQAAAHLHHTNIVPVHAVGCERGVHFYAMQYIEGQTVAALIRELRQLAGLEAPDPSASAVPASALAGELLSGRWAPAKEGPAGDVHTGQQALPQGAVGVRETGLGRRQPVQGVRHQEEGAGVLRPRREKGGGGSGTGWLGGAISSGRGSAGVHAALGRGLVASARVARLRPNFLVKWCKATVETRTSQVRSMKSRRS
jgi:hypothetical protein